MHSRWINSWNGNPWVRVWLVKSYGVRAGPAKSHWLTQTLSLLIHVNLMPWKYKAIEIYVWHWDKLRGLPR